MKALLKFGTTEDRARELVEICRKKGYVLQHKNHREPLTKAIIQEGGFTVNFGGYGSYSRLGLGNNFGTKWEISGLEASPCKGFTGVDACFGSGVDANKEEAIAEYVKKQGGGGGSVINNGVSAIRFNAPSFRQKSLEAWQAEGCGVIINGGLKIPRYF